MTRTVYPSLELASIDVGRIFISDGKLYILLAHLPHCVLIARYYWFDKVLDSIVQRLREKIRRIRLYKEEDTVDPKIVSNNPKP